MTKSYNCSKCQRKHPRPVGKKCNLNLSTEPLVDNTASFHNASEMSRTSTPVAEPPRVTEPSLNDKLEIIASALSSIQEAQHTMSQRIEKLEHCSPDKPSSNTSVWDTLSHTLPGNGSSPTLVKQRSPRPIPTLQDLRADINAHAATTRRIQQLETLAKDNFMLNEGKAPYLCKQSNVLDNVPKSKKVWA